MSFLPEAGHGGAIASHVAIANELTAHTEFGSFVPWEEAGVVYAPHGFHFVCELLGSL
jgi:hypothetical protein